MELVYTACATPTPPGPLRPPGGVRQVDTPSAEPHRVAQACNHAPLRHWQALRAATAGRHHGDSGGQAPGGGSARSRDRRAADGLRRQQQLRRDGGTLAPLHMQTRAGRSNSPSSGTYTGMGLKDRKWIIATIRIPSKRTL